MTRVVPVPSYTDPRNPRAAAGSINFGVASNFPGVDDHPLEHSSDYGQRFSNGDAAEEVDEREVWTKAQWEELAESYDLSKNGTKAELIDRVLEHEAQLEAEKEGDN